MPDNIDNPGTETKTRHFPTVTMWNRLEGRPRTDNFDRALKAEVRDALWMITKQWQMGELKGADAGSPVFAKTHIATNTLSSFTAAGNAPQAYNQNMPLEVKAEQMNIPFSREAASINISIRLRLGKYWLKLLKNEGLNYAQLYIDRYTFRLPAKDISTGYIYAHKDVWQQYAAISGRCMDGYALYENIIHGNPASDVLQTNDPNKTAIDKLGGLLVKWFAAVYTQPGEEQKDAWLPEKLEYSFECSASAIDKDIHLSAGAYTQGQLDWYAFDINEQPASNGPTAASSITRTFIPTQISFNGMPDTRWWKFEDGKTSFGNIKPSTTDLSKLLLMEFGLVFANDWFLIPFTLPIGSLAKIEGLTVKNNFGEPLWINPVEKPGAGNNAWSMFKLHAPMENNTLFLAPAAIKVMESRPLEEIVLIRDEMSNMVWGIESIVPSAMGTGCRGNEFALQTRHYHEQLAAASNAAPTAAQEEGITYLAMTDTPEHWIPFVPVHVKGSNRKIQLQRGSMLRTIPGTAPVKIKPVTSLLREGLDALHGVLPYYINEEEVPRSGIKVTQTFQRTRWINGEVFNWLGRKKRPGKGEGTSGLAFDQIKY